MLFDVRAAKQLKPGEHLVVEGCEGLRLVPSASRDGMDLPLQAAGNGTDEADLDRAVSDRRSGRQ